MTVHYLNNSLRLRYMLKSPGYLSHDENTTYYGRPVLDPFYSVRCIVGAVSLGL